jgi:hypothetical protein
VTDPVIKPIHCGRCRTRMGELIEDPPDSRRVELVRASYSPEGEGAQVVGYDPSSGKSRKRNARWWDASPAGWSPDNPTRWKYDCGGKHHSTVGYVTMDRLTTMYHKAVAAGDREILLFA